MKTTKGNLCHTDKMAIRAILNAGETSGKHNGTKYYLTAKSGGYSVMYRQEGIGSYGRERYAEIEL